MSLPPMSTSVLLPAEAVAATARAAVPPRIAALIAMDLRLPAAGEARERQVGLLNHLVDGTDVFVQTDREFEPIVERELRHVAAVEYADGDPPPMSDPERRQWWRLQQVWALLRRHERETDHRYEFVFKLRTDLDITGDARLADIYSRASGPHGPSWRLSAGRSARGCRTERRGAYRRAIWRPVLRRLEGIVRWLRRAPRRAPQRGLRSPRVRAGARRGRRAEPRVRGHSRCTGAPAGARRAGRAPDAPRAPVRPPRAPPAPAQRLGDLRAPVGPPPAREARRGAST